MDNEIRERMQRIIDELRHDPELRVSSVTLEYARRHGIDGRIWHIACELLGGTDELPVTTVEYLQVLGFKRRKPGGRGVILPARSVKPTAA